MSVAASHWAWRMGVGSPGAKLVLMVLADYADESGECFPFVSTIAERAEQSVATVHRRLRELEAAGLIERVEQYTRQGARTRNLFRLLMNAKAAETAVKEDAPPSQLESAPLSSCDSPPVTGERGYVSTVRELEEDQPPLEPPLDKSPYSPPVGGEARGSRADRGGEADGTQLDTLIAELIAADSEMIIDRPAARRQWAKLDASERAKALAGVARYVERWRSAGKKFKLRSPSSYLKGRIWHDMALAPPEKAVERPRLDTRSRAVQWACSDASRANWIFIEAGTDAWADWERAFREEGRPLPVASAKMADVGGGRFERRHGRSFPMERPPPRGTPATDADAAE